MLIEENIIKEDFINISREQEKKIKEFVEYYFSLYSKSLITPKYERCFLLALSDSYNFFSNKAEWEKIGYELCKKIKYRIESNGIESGLGMIGGLGYTAFGVQEYYNKTNNLKNFSKSLNKILLKNSVAYVNSLVANKCNIYNTYMKDYDAINGLSGITYYLMDYVSELEEKKQLEKMIFYLISLTGYHDYKRHRIMNFHVTCENQFLEDEKEIFPDGNFNFGISHGMLGPLITLAKAYHLGYRTVGIEKAINELVTIYEKFKIYNDDIPLWPSQLAFDDYISGNFHRDIRSTRSSWCYGNVAIARGLQKVAYYMGDKDMQVLYEEELIKILNQPIKNYNLNLPTLCHGYASTLSIRVMAYREKRDKRFLKNIEHELNIILDLCMSHKKEDYIGKTISEVFEDDLSFLQGAGGVVLTLMGLFNENIKYTKLLMID